MKTRIAFGFIVTMFVLTLPAYAGGTGELQKYFNDAAAKVKATNNPSEKRQILNESFQNMSKALDMVEKMPSTSKEDVAGINRIKTSIQDEQNELAGTNGYVRVPDKQLNAFSNYVVQNMEQANTTVTISLVTLILLAILLVLIV